MSKRQFLRKNAGPIRCPVGRPFDLAHATCRSCTISCRERTGKKHRPPALPIQTCVVGNRLITTLYLSSLNAWNNRPRYLYTNERKKWERVLRGAEHIWGRATGKRTLLILRLVPSRKHLLSDFDNLIGSTKPVKDVLTRSGVLLDDSDDLLEFEVRQDVDRDNPRTEIILS